MKFPTKFLGLALIFFSLVLSSIVWSYTSELKKSLTPECKAYCGSYLGSVCPGASWLPIQTYIGFTSIIILVIIGAFFVFRNFDQDEREVRWSNLLGGLEGDEKILFKMVMESGGAAFQADLVKESGFSKAKASRTLDKLEARGIVEKRRRGMTNLILAK